MSLTGPDHLYTALHEEGANDLMRAIYMQRGHYFHYGSTAPSSSSFTHQQPFPGGIPWKVDFTLPRIDFHLAIVPQGLTAGLDHLVISTQATLTVAGVPVLTQDVWAVAVPVAQPPAITFQVTATQVGSLPPQVTILVTQMLNSALAVFTLPYPAFSLGWFTIVLAGGPRIDNNELTLRGNL